MSVQCKKCENATKIENYTICKAWKNPIKRNAKKQRLCERYVEHRSDHYIP